MNSAGKRKIIVSSFLVLISFLLLRFFDFARGFQYSAVVVAFLVLLPFFYVKIVLKEKISNYGWQWRKSKKDLFLILFLVLLTVSISYILFSYTRFGKYYEIPKGVTQDFSVFLKYEILIMPVLYVAYELFFRGFILFSLTPFLGRLAVIGQLIVFGLFFYPFGAIDLKNIFPVLLALISGIVAYQTKSAFKALAYSFSSAVLVDALAIMLIYR